MTEVPEHLLARSRARRAAMGGGGGDVAAPTESAAPSTTAATPEPVAAAAVPAQPAVPAEPDPVPPWVEAAETRKKIPVWAIPVLGLLPLWAVLYALTLDPATPTELGPYEEGAVVYAEQGCAGCHGASGAGAGAVPALDVVTTVFERPVDQITWVALASAGYQSLGLTEFSPGHPLAGGTMPSHINTLTAEQVMAVVLHERHAFSGEEEFDPELWKTDFAEVVEERMPEKAAEYIAVLEEWEASPPEAP